MRLIPFIFLSIFLNLSLFAEGEALQEVSIGLSESTYGKDFFNMLFSLFILLGLLFVSVWFIKRLMRSRLNASFRHSEIQILERRALTPKSSLYLITVFGKALLIADSQQGVEMLAEFPYEEEKEELKEETHPSFLKSSFATLLQRKIKEPDAAARKS